MYAKIALVESIVIGLKYMACLHSLPSMLRWL